MDTRSKIFENIFLLPREGRGLTFFLLLEAGGSLRLGKEARKRGRVHKALTNNQLEAKTLGVLQVELSISRGNTLPALSYFISH
jgi:hypothetical protein